MASLFAGFYLLIYLPVMFAQAETMRDFVLRRVRTVRQTGPAVCSALHALHGSVNDFQGTISYRRRPEINAGLMSRCTCGIESTVPQWGFS